MAVDWKSWSFMGLLLALAVAIYLRPSGFSSVNSAAVSKMLDEKAAWQQELTKPYPFIVGEVPTITWDYSDPNFAETIVKGGKPVILKNSPIRQWKALKQWRPSYLASKLPVLKRTQAHENRTFSYFKEAKPLAKLPEIRSRHKSSAFVSTDVKTEMFFKLAKDVPSKKGMFYYSVVAFDDLGVLQHDIQPLSPFISLPASVKAKLAAEEPGVEITAETRSKHRLTTVWFGPSGATTQAHYDVHDNFYAQLYGRKRFILFPPEQYRELYLNGFLHSGAQQSQVDLEHPDYERFPRFKDVAALDAVIEAGDVLYLPSLWFHHVIALDLSFSVSIWSKNEETAHMWQAEAITPPIRTSWSTSKLALAGHVFLRQLIAKSFTDLPAAQNPQEDPFTYLRSYQSFVHDVFEQRYSRLVQDAPSLARQQLDDPNLYCNLDVRQHSKSNDERLTQEELNDLGKSTDRFAELLRKVESPSARALWLGNFCEHIALGVTQLPHMIAYLQSLAECQ
jgi:oxalate decarboxylase/phosphoglucose isomerase-like protein (cupin superfamily)